ncbi:hypothetical protein VOLCADRAFT_107337 [Volvox carteri f. nagariensis]|uniref:MLO-like protein n=1 Tax=Volvox carteri f. nagariensis TaxID=3068 RepID=D8UDD3_VOLCA|nr:uncharacterized protein VOLCADRAFT_107337 [Volvox carteri f. nagariensis]EFJ42245.1 hypothetical protein VOLCADRAFT_107337 [Volvox carteri f. nagariensis]|eukprot:XP_002956643.1 hypothetical protein VOLCADRAFT_107337 [Volvox carteri f. nagariensis]
MGSTVVEPSTIVEGWRMALLLLAFATVTFILEKAAHGLEHIFKKQRGLAIGLEHIKNELLCVGSISLLLSAFQNLLAQICIPLSKVSVYTDRRRRLLAGGAETYCQPYKQSLWPVSLQHDTHIFIFVVACTHVVYGTLTVYLTIWRVRSWRKWEVAAQQQANSMDIKVMKMPAKWLYRNVGSNSVIHFFLMLLRQYQMSVNQSLYNNARVLFIEKAGLDYKYNFHDVVVRGLEDELMLTLRPEWHLWMIAVVWYAIPPPAYVSFWMYGLGVLMIMLVGGKLVDVLVQISVQVAIKYGDSVVFGRMDENPRARGRIETLGRSSMHALGTAKRSFLQRGMDQTSKALEHHHGEDDPEWIQNTNNLGVLANVFRMPSRQHVLQMIRSMAPQASSGVAADAAAGADSTGGGHGSGNDVGAGAVSPTKGQQHEEAGGQVAASPHVPAGPPPPPHPPAVAPQTPTTAAAAGAAAAVATQPSGSMRLVRRSAPPDLRGRHPQRFDFSDGAAVGSFNAAGGAGHGAPAAAGAPLPTGITRNMSVAAGSHARHHHHRHHYHFIHPQHHHSHNRHNRHRSRDQAGLEGMPSTTLPLPPLPPSPQNLQPQGEGGGSPRFAEAQPAGTFPDKRRSAFELFQRHPEHQVRALSLRRALNFILGPPEDPGTSPPRQQQLLLPPLPLPEDHHAPRSLAGSMAAVQADGKAFVARNPGASAASGSASSRGFGGAPTEMTNGITAADTLLDFAESGAVGRQQYHQQQQPPSGKASDAVTRVPSSARGVMLPSAGSIRSRVCGGSSDQGSISVRRGPRVLRFKRTASGRWKVPMLMRPFYCGTHVKGRSQYVRDMLQQRKDRGVHQLDAKDFFWFKRPRFMTMLFTLAYFQNSLSIAICIFSLAGMQDTVGTWEGVPKWAIILQLCLDMVLMPQVSLSILPLYALIQPLGSHCPQDLIKYAKEKEEKAKKSKYGRYQRQWLSELSSHILGDSTTKTEKRSILGSLGKFLRSKKKGGERPSAQEEVAAPPPAVQRLGSQVVGEALLALSRANGFSPSGRASSEAAREMRLRPNGTSPSCSRTLAAQLPMVPHLFKDGEATSLDHTAVGKGDQQRVSSAHVAVTVDRQAELEPGLRGPQAPGWLGDGARQAAGTAVTAAAPAMDPFNQRSSKEQ